MKQNEEVFVNPYSSQSKLYVLKHKDLDVAMVQVDCAIGKIEYILDVYITEELPIGCDKDGNALIQWWESRAIPDTRKGIQQVLYYVREKTNLSLIKK